MGYILADSGLAPWGNAAAIIIGLYFFVSIIIGVALAAGLMFGFSLLRDKIELIKKIRPLLNDVNLSLVATEKGEPLPESTKDNKIIQAVVQVPKVAAMLPGRAASVEQKVEQGSDRVAGAVIEFYARTAMAQGIVKAFFLPGLTRSRPQIAQEVIPFQEEIGVVPIEEIREETHEEQPLEEEMIMVQTMH